MTPALSNLGPLIYAFMSNNIDSNSALLVWLKRNINEVKRNALKRLTLDTAKNSKTYIATKSGSDSRYPWPRYTVTPKELFGSLKLSPRIVLSSSRRIDV